MNALNKKKNGESKNVNLLRTLQFHFVRMHLTKSITQFLWKAYNSPHLSHIHWKLCVVLKLIEFSNQPFDFDRGY